jgi:hypothetical protein
MISFRSTTIGDGIISADGRAQFVPCAKLLRAGLQIAREVAWCFSLRVEFANRDRDTIPIGIIYVLKVVPEIE